MIWFANTALGAALFAGSKIWCATFPAIWRLGINREKISWSPARKGGFGMGVISGLVISAVIVGVYWALKDSLIDLELMRERMAAMGLDRRPVYIGLMAYWILFNSVLEEYIWRWFVVEQAMKATGKPYMAMLISALGFTIHHIIALQAYMPWSVVLLCNAGIFIGALFWSWCYVRYESIWPGYVSHAIVDVAVFGVGYVMIFG